MKKILLATLSCAALTQFSFAAKDVTTHPEVYFLQESQSIDSLALLPPPPAMDSIDFLNDKAQYDAGKIVRNTPRGKQAYDDAHVAGDGVAAAFSNAFGLEIAQRKTPELFKLVIKMREDAGDLATRSAKNHYMRIRPFAFYNEATCRPDEESTLSKNGSYPSGHTTIGWATALVLAEINPARQGEILQRGYDMGQSRVICGYHWQSDVTAARMAASAMVARLHAEPTFAAQLQKAKDEFNGLKK
ncbi:phosphatase PAP2 family protein [Serratia ficaria]|uniref:acid phosphatase n=1 Tax=Serratia TaxID=613 RepID=UPI001013C41F|nr:MULTISPECIES: phosphatase PAP2 family protein [Serratia]MEE4483513.1 phosphatase PAP2 family protein [Serratia ficaria]CAI1110812.1 Major phosphate-irrepressible acid phosphatase precursor [Serratia ficaria]CAI1894717.1 Major phosphate-irrepressible acid phosphatase precursor [Serratia ficaria]